MSTSTLSKPFFSLLSWKKGTLDVILVSFDYRSGSLDDTIHSNVSKFGRGGAHGHKPNQLFQDNLVGHDVGRLGLGLVLSRWVVDK